MPNPTPEALAAAHAAYDEARESGCHERDAMEAAVEAALAASKAEAAGGEAVDLIPWLYVIRSEFLPDDASLGRESDRKMREALDWATNAMRDRAALSQQPGVPDLAMAMHWIDRYAAGIDGECQLDRVCDALGVQYAAAPQPGKEG